MDYRARPEGQRCVLYAVLGAPSKLRALGRGVEWLTRFEGCDWPYSQLEPFDWKRLAPMKAALASQTLGEAPELLKQHRASPAHSAYSGIHPYWYL